MVQLIDEHREQYGVEPMCAVLPMAPSTYFRHKDLVARPERRSARAQRDEALRAVIQRIWDDNYQVYGPRKVWKELRREGRRVARCTVERLMRAMGLRGAVRGRAWITTTTPEMPAVSMPDLVKRDFTVTAPNQLWVSDFTYVATWSGFVYVAFVIDAFARRIVGWRVSASMRTDFVLDALEQAVYQRSDAGLAGLVHHSDRGTQGGFNRSSQRLNSEELRWEDRGVVDHGARDVRRCGHRGAPRRGVESTGVGSGKRSPVAYPAKMLRWRPACPRRLAQGGSARMEACPQCVWRPWWGVIYRLPSEKKSRCCTPSRLGFVRSRGESAGPHQPSRGNFAAMRPPVAGDLSIAPAPHSGTPTGRREDPRWRNWRPTTNCAGTCRTDWLA